jgi:hypothetical protein
MVVAYLRADFETGRALATVRHRAATIALGYRTAGLPDPCKVDCVRQTLKALARRDTEARRAKGLPRLKQAEGLRQRDADRIAERTTSKVEGGAGCLRDLRDLAVVLVGRDLMARASELVSITVEAIERTETAATIINLARIKTDTESMAIALGPEAAAALAAWIVAVSWAGFPTGPVFRAISKASKDRDGQLRDKAIGVRDVTRIVKNLAGDEDSSHSLRGGMAQNLRARQFRAPSDHAGRRVEDRRNGGQVHCEGGCRAWNCGGVSRAPPQVT